MLCASKACKNANQSQVLTGFLVTFIFYGVFSLLVILFAEPLVDSMVPALASIRGWPSSHFIVCQGSSTKPARRHSDVHSLGNGGGHQPGSTNFYACDICLAEARQSDLCDDYFADVLYDPF